MTEKTKQSQDNAISLRQRTLLAVAQGLLAYHGGEGTKEQLVKATVYYTDALLSEMKKKIDED